MGYTVNDIEKIAQFKSWNTKKKIDELLRIDCSLYTNLGSDSTAAEIKQVKSKSKKIYRVIKTLNRKMGEDFLTAMRNWSE